MASIDDAVQTEAPRSRSRLRGGLVTVGTVAALLAAMGLTVLGLGAADNAVANYDASSWLWSAARSELARVNGVTARVDTRIEIPGRPAAPDAGHPDRPAADPAGPADRAGQLAGSGHPPAHRDHPDHPRPGRQRRPARGRGVRRRRRAGHRPAARPAFADPGRRAGALSAGHHRRHLRRQGPALDRGAQRGHRLGDHRRQAAVRAGVGRARGRRAQPAAGRVVRRRRRQPRAGRLHPGRRGGGARPHGRARWCGCSAARCTRRR